MVVLGSLLEYHGHSQRGEDWNERKSIFISNVPLVSVEKFPISLVLRGSSRTCYRTLERVSFGFHIYIRSPSRGITIYIKSTSGWLRPRTWERLEEIRRKCDWRNDKEFMIYVWVLSTKNFVAKGKLFLRERGLLTNEKCEGIPEQSLQWKRLTVLY